ncbi:RNA polymerase-associated protein RapA [Moorella thermoacetica]|uniref:DEAD/DEAH box helicase n=1 Tax=Neomoorella thermoacetica TaxID=1525 RepID=UPI0011E65C2B|nr:helicase-related protein [Moorella thermoacetica]TYL08304.1 RNA polymerase-associated protein RapA [Moorella thermoacetica]
MQPGILVRSTIYPEKGIGLVLGNEEFFDQVYVHVFFEKTRERLTLPLADLSPLHDPLAKMEAGSFSTASRFQLRWLVEQILAENSGEGLLAAGGFKIIPLPHQLLAVSFVLDQFKLRVLIADEVGLGKTIEAALIYEELKARGMVKRVLVVAPSGLCLQWREEMKTKFGEDFIIYDRSTVHSLKQLHGEMTNVWTLADRVITSLDFIKPKKITADLDERAARARRWHNEQVFAAAAAAWFDMVIFDEAHKLTKDMTGEETARYKAGHALVQAAPIVLLLTATPHQGDQHKFRNLLRLIDPYLFSGEGRITAEDVKKVTVRNNKRAVVDFHGNRLFKQRVATVCLIHRDEVADQVELDLYRAVTDYVTTFYELARQQNNFTMMFLLLIYQRMVSSSSPAILKSLSARLAALEELRRRAADQEPESEREEPDWDDLQELTAEEQLAELTRASAAPRAGIVIVPAALAAEIAALKKCLALAERATAGRNDIKFTRLLEIINELRIQENNPRLKFIIFTEFRETQAYLEERLTSLGYRTALINGAMSTTERIAQVERFRREADFLISTDAGGEGINLQFCHILINYDLPWNPMRLEQRIGRIDRIGQEHDVKVINLQLADTVENRVREVIENKLDTIRREFCAGEDKLADILGVLQDEFDFEKVYIEALLKQGRKAANLDALSWQIFERAREIVEEERLALPISNLAPEYVLASQRDLEKRAKRVQRLVEQYLQVYGASLHPYKLREGVYYFQDPRSGRRLHNVIFQQKYALANEGAELLSFQHPYMVELLAHLEDALREDTSAKLLVRERKFSGEKGFLFIYRLTLTNYLDPTVYYLVPCFVSFAGDTGRVNGRISRYFRDWEQLICTDLVTGEIPYNLKEAWQLARKAVQQEAEVLFFQAKERLEKRLRDEEEKFEKYYKDREAAIEKIAVDNIRAAKKKELEEDRKTRRQEWLRRRQLVPSLSLEQVAYVEFA